MVVTERKNYSKDTISSLASLYANINIKEMRDYEVNYYLTINTMASLRGQD